jgi:deoxyribonuclease V
MDHPWNLTPKEAIALQKELRDKVVLSPLRPKKIRHIAGCDVSMNLYSKTIFAGFVVLTYPDLEIVDHAVVKEETDFPYIPGLLSFREIPALLHAWEKLSVISDVICVDGVGIAHPRRLGIASHLGLILDKPTIGVAKSVLTGIYEEPGIEAGAMSPLVDKHNNEEVLGVALRTKRKVKPMFISPGHKITTAEAIEIVLACVRKHRMPESTRQAHEITNQYRRDA